MNHKIELTKFMDRLVEEAETTTDFESKKKAFDMAFGAFVFTALELNSEVSQEIFDEYNNFWEYGYREKFRKAGCFK